MLQLEVKWLGIPFFHTEIVIKLIIKRSCLCRMLVGIQGILFVR